MVNEDHKIFKYLRKIGKYAVVLVIILTLSIVIYQFFSEEGQIMDVPDFASILVGVFVVFGFGVSAYYHSKQKDTNDASLTMQISNEISNREAKLKNVINFEDLDIWAADYVNFLDIIAHMLINKKLSNSNSEVFKNHLVDGYRGILFQDKKEGDNNFHQSLPDLIKWGEKNNILDGDCTLEIKFDEIKNQTI